MHIYPYLDQNRDYFCFPQKLMLNAALLKNKISKKIGSNQKILQKHLKILWKNVLL